MLELKEIGEFVKTVTRPFCLAWMVPTISLMVYQGKDVPTWFWGTFVPMFIWWGVDRSLKHRTERKALSMPGGEK